MFPVFSNLRPPYCTGVDCTGMGLRLPITVHACAGRSSLAFTARLLVSVTPPNEAETVVPFGQRLGSVLTVNVALVNPAATVTLEGTVAADVLLLESATTDPPAGAGPLSVTVPVEELPPCTLG